TEPPPELTARPDLFVNLRLLRNLDKLQHSRPSRPSPWMARTAGSRADDQQMRSVLAVMLLMATAAPSGAQRYVRDWQQLSPEEKQRAWDNYRRYQEMPQQRRNSLENNFQRFQSMPPEEQQRLRQNYDAYRNQNPTQRQQFNEQYRRWRSGKH